MHTILFPPPPLPTTTPLEVGWAERNGLAQSHPASLSTLKARLELVSRPAL